MTRIDFEEISLTGEKNIKCNGGCGRRLKRRKKFCQTINPFNLNAERQVKSKQEIYEELRLDLRIWETETEKCIHC